MTQNLSEENLRGLIRSESCNEGAQKPYELRISENEVLEPHQLRISQHQAPEGKEKALKHM